MEGNSKKPNSVNSKDRPRYQVCSHIERDFQLAYADSIGTMLGEILTEVQAYVEQDTPESD